MSELKSYDLVDIQDYRGEVYRKSEADKVIAEKDKQIDLYKRGWEESDRINEHLYAQLRHSNYKRCLAMAKWCELERTERFSVLYPKDFGYLLMKKWRKIWLELAKEPTWAKFLLLIHPEEKL